MCELELEQSKIIMQFKILLIKVNIWNPEELPLIYKGDTLKNKSMLIVISDIHEKILLAVLILSGVSISRSWLGCNTCHYMSNLSLQRLPTARHSAEGWQALDTQKLLHRRVPDSYVTIPLSLLLYYLWLVSSWEHFLSHNNQLFSSDSTQLRFLSEFPSLFLCWHIFYLLPLKYTWHMDISLLMRIIQMNPTE